MSDGTSQCEAMVMGWHSDPQRCSRRAMQEIAGHRYCNQHANVNADRLCERCGSTFVTSLRAPGRYCVNCLAADAEKQG